MSRRDLILAEIGHRTLWQPRHPPVGAQPALSAATIPESTSHITMAVAAPPSPAAENTSVAEPPSPAAPTAIVAAAPIPIADWDDLQGQVSACQQCQLAKTRNNTVVGRGNNKARVLLIGEAPGEQEDRQGLPFVGKAGQLLENMLAAAGIDSARDVYICNLLKCRPPGNRNPAQDEITKCNRFLQWQIDAVQPELIVAVGRFAAQSLLQNQASLSSLRGKLHQHGRYPVLVSFHPAYLLRSPTEKAKAWQDWCRVRQLLKQQ
ncbi:uracil-DNA glycosylase family protein [Vogesella sp. GCM10023246]|uniref:Type-4 uracil-DNA glycosylase n=1 Tax=Vogesella oryzagri TaxID=3160864 RepID=A0ABV1M6B6_9NEIS